ncbi:hypothetical protein COY95_04460, partial [Candidatus Woesearchaeota archaeon CG_4_10_14_0_8_um_filter_47_5]
FHEDAWAGGGNFGPCMEFFSRGLELGNQVYMLFEQTPSGPTELSLKVLDMGMGLERNAWFTQGTATSYETTFPPIIKKLYQKTGLATDQHLLKKFLPFSSYLNVDEVEDIEATWKEVAKKIGTDAAILKEAIQPAAALFSVAEHTRTLLFALSDGSLPSNVGDEYNLRVILRRSLAFIDKYGWDIELAEIAQWHASYLKPMFPELSEMLAEVEKILDVEKKKYKNTREKSHKIIQSALQSAITTDQLIDMYDTQGISPEIIREEAQKLGKTIQVPAIPTNFYALVAEKHEKTVQVHETKRALQLDLEGIPGTVPLYYEDYSRTTCQATVLKIISPNDVPNVVSNVFQNVVLDRTIFYPTSGGQLHDIGTINNRKVVDVFKQGDVIVHTLAAPLSAPTVPPSSPSAPSSAFAAGSSVACTVDPARRKQLAQHHTATHILNAVCREVLGNHINQASAKKTPEKAHLDITHYAALTQEELASIEEHANDLIKQHIPVRSHLLPKDEAEKRYSMRIYQGGAVPGKTVRIIEIVGVDVEACGGTHLNNTLETEQVKILKSTKISDSIVRIEFTAGNAAAGTASREQEIIKEISTILGVSPQYVPARAEELFIKWKKARKLIQKIKDPAYIALIKKGEVDADLTLSSKIASSENILEETAHILKTQPEHLSKTLRRFMDELSMWRQEIDTTLNK